MNNLKITDVTGPIPVEFITDEEDSALAAADILNALRAKIGAEMIRIKVEADGTINLALRTMDGRLSQIEMEGDF